ncbi:MAG TPA: ABC transporter substrate-binding protein, partial [Chloroflexota bacterium]
PLTGRLGRTAMDVGAQGGAHRAVIAMLLVIFAVTGCGPGAAGPASNPAPAVAPPVQARPLVIYVREPRSLAIRPFQTQAGAIAVSQRLFNATLALVDEKAVPRPQLVDTLPQLNTDTWRVFPDGRMETTYRLKPNLTWHDGQPLTADDFVFSRRVYATPDFGFAAQPPLAAIQDMTAVDALTFTIRWKEPYPDAHSLSVRTRELPALPRHIMEPAFDQLALTGTDALVNHPFWSQEYVGLGPYRLQQREPGSFVEAVRFDGYALGPPKIDRIILRFSSDANVVLASLLAGEAQGAADSTLGQAVAATLQREWASANAGTVINSPSTWRYTGFQLKTELTTPRAILDLRVRKAIAHAIDRPPANEAAYGGQAILADSMISANSEWGPAMDTSIVTYPYDLRRTEALMGEAGFTKGPDGTYMGPSERFSAELATQESQDSVPELLVMADGLRRAGFEVRERVIPAAQSQDVETLVTYPAMLTTTTFIGEPALITLLAAQIPLASNRWRGSNRSGWSDPEFERLFALFDRTLDHDQRGAPVRQMVRIYSEQLPLVSLYFPASFSAYVAAVKGPAVAAPESSPSWNLHQWEFQ